MSQLVALEAPKCIKNHSKMFEVTTNFRNFISHSFCGTGVGNCKSWLSTCTIQGPL